MSTQRKGTRAHLAPFVVAATLSLTHPAGAAQPEDTWKDWVPGGWKLILSAVGDLDGDGTPDAVLVIEKDDPANRKANDGLGERQLNFNPRTLRVLLRSGHGYREAARSERFLPTAGSDDNPCLLDPLIDGGVTVERRTLKIDLHYWLSCGSYGVAHNKFTFRLENGRLRLVGLDRLEFMRNTGASVDSSINFLTGRAKTTTGNMFDDSQPKVGWRRLGTQSPLFLDEMTSECLVDGTPQRWCEY